MNMEMQAQSDSRPRLLFVDDEQRVLNSMRIMFRREFDLYLASHGQEALDIVKDRDIDVIVADHRMPQMTGVEVLTKVRKLSPRTVRILLTGYADLDAVEGSINEGEVFRFLTKPCPPQQLRATVELAAKLARSTPPPPPEPVAEGDEEEALEIILEADTFREVERRNATEQQDGSFASTTVLPAHMKPVAPATPTAYHAGGRARRCTAGPHTGRRARRTHGRRRRPPAGRGPPPRHPRRRPPRALPPGGSARPSPGRARRRCRGKPPVSSRRAR